jgi:hypothetical protein
MRKPSKIAMAAERIETALTRAARSRAIPDYSGFQASLAPLLERERTVRLNKVHSEAPPYATAALILLGRYHKKIVEGPPSAMNFRRYKLLRSLFADNGRGQQLVDALLYGTLPADPTLDTEEVSPAVLRMRLLVAIQKSEFEDANFLLGRLDEVDHDAGERAYLQALASFASGKLERTVKLVENVANNAIDRPRAAWLAAKASAILGDVETLEKILCEIGDHLTPCAWLHLLELPDSVAKAQSLVAAFEQRLATTLVLKVDDPAYEEWAVHHVQMIGLMNIRTREISEVSSATGDFPADEAIAADPIFRRCAGAMMVEHKLRGAEYIPDITRWTSPIIARGSISALRKTVEMLSDAGDYVGIVKLAKRFSKSDALQWQRELDIVNFFYIAATITNDQMAKRMQRLLTDELSQPANFNAKRAVIAARLTSMGRISFLTSAADLECVLKSSNNWRDCGLISLGLVRALEKEINARVVRPLAARLDFAQLVSNLPQIDTAKGLRASLGDLQRASSSGDGLMLGSIRSLLERMRQVGSEDPQLAGVRDRIRASFESLLSHAGRRPSALDEIATMIGPDIVGRFRNPPAHGQFLRLDDAAAALLHVENALDRLSQWMPNACP